eukprot:TRINITY_DN12418_c0_g1_i1.p1 TRINITY_DN12418_c0_g1~~TRINITY_DN12418_c0_g1_i1.p1  ORF type:complete len:815 (-),score=136.47 TRINITY_DN12418_c0_g1_i1:126-2570(-)
MRRRVIVKELLVLPVFFSRYRTPLIAGGVALLFLLFLAILLPLVLIEPSDGPVYLTPTYPLYPSSYPQQIEERNYDDTYFPESIVAGAVAAQDAILSLHSRGPSSFSSNTTTHPPVTLVVWKQVENEWVKVSESEWDLSRANGTQFSLEDLDASSAYLSVVYTNPPEPSFRSLPTRFRTQPLSSSQRKRAGMQSGVDDSVPRIRFGATSDLGYTNAPWPSLSHAAREDLDFFLIAGNSLRVEEELAGSYSDRWSRALSTQGLRELSSSTSIVPAIGDGDILHGINTFIGTASLLARSSRDELFGIALPAMLDAFPITQSGPTQFTQLHSYGCALTLIVLDLETERTPDQLISVEQMDWLKESVSQSQSVFTIIASSAPISNLTSALDTLGDVGGALLGGIPTNAEDLIRQFFPLDTVVITSPFEIPGSNLTLTLPRPLAIEDLLILFDVTYEELISSVLEPEGSVLEERLSSMTIFDLLNRFPLIGIANPLGPLAIFTVPGVDPALITGFVTVGGLADMLNATLPFETLTVAPNVTITRDTTLAEAATALNTTVEGVAALLIPLIDVSSGLNLFNITADDFVFPQASPSPAASPVPAPAAPPPPAPPSSQKRGLGSKTEREGEGGTAKKRQITIPSLPPGTIFDNIDLSTDLSQLFASLTVILQIQLEGAIQQARDLLGILPDSGWALYPDQREDFLNFLSSSTTEGVFFVSGGTQLGGVAPVDSVLYPNGVEILVGPAGTHHSLLKHVLPILNLVGSLGPTRVAYLDAWPYSRFSIDGLKREVTVDFINDMNVNILSVPIQFGEETVLRESCE